MMKINFLSIIPAAFDALQKGKRLNNVVAWKNIQIVTNMLAAVVVLLRALGIDLGLSESDVDTVAGSIVVIINVYLTLATTNKVGISPELPPIDMGGRTDGEWVQRHQPVDLSPSVDLQSPDRRAPADQQDRGGWNG